MGPKMRRPGGISLRQGLDRDIYQAVKKLEDGNDGKPFKSVATVYDAIKRSNSSLSRQKKRPLEDAIERVLEFRKEELADSSDSEAEIEDAVEPNRPEEDRFLLNRQMTKHWRADTPDVRPAKKRRVQEDGDDRDARSSGGETLAARANGQAGDKADSGPKKPARTTRYQVEHLKEAPSLGGIDEIRQTLLDSTEYFLKRRLPNGWEPVPGIILSGPQGTGKRSLVRSLAAELDVPLVSLNGCLDDAERLEKSLTEAIDEAMRLAPSIILIKQLDWYMPRSGGQGHTEQNRKVVAQFTRQMERIRKQQPRDKPVLAMATTSMITDVDQFLLQSDIFPEVIQTRMPDPKSREDIFRTVLGDREIADDVDFSQLARLTHSFVGADIKNVIWKVQKLVATREKPNPTLHEQDASISNAPELEVVEPAPSAPITLEDFQTAIKGYTPSLRKEGFSVIPDVTWDQVGAMAKTRDQLDMSIIGPIQQPELFREYGLHKPSGVLLWGPPGCGKTLVAQAVANEAQASFILINGPELLNKYVGESERGVRELFNRARSSTPCILFFDEIDSLVPKRDNASTESGARVVNALLTELDGAQDRTGIYVIGTTNRPDMIDVAMLRPGRLSVRLFVDLPTEDERVDILKTIYRSSHTVGGNKTYTLSVTEAALLERIARDSRCEDFSGADLGGLHIKAAECALRRYRRDPGPRKGVHEEDWEYALASTKRSVSNPGLYRKLDSRIGRSD